MLYCAPYENQNVMKFERKEDAFWIYLEHGLQKLIPVDAGIIRVMYTKKADFSSQPKPGILDLKPFSDWTYEENAEDIRLKLPGLCVVINKLTNQFQYLDGEGNLLLREKQNRGKELDEYPIFQMAEDTAKKEFIDTPDGRKEMVREAARIQTGTAYHTRVYYEWGDEALYGLGQHEEGYHSLRGQRVYLMQGNRRIAIPLLVSTKGYGILLNTYAPAIFNDTAEGSYLYTETDPEMDFFFISGVQKSKNQEGQADALTLNEEDAMLVRAKGTFVYESFSPMDCVIQAYRRITGKAALLPKWAFGYIQSQERYETQEEILRIAREYRQRSIGLDCIVLDWCSWKDGEWGQKTFDPVHFPNPDAMMAQLHQNHVHFMISIWPNLTQGTPNYEEFKEKGLLLPGINNYNPLAEEGRRVYWKQANEGLFSHGVDAWWCDNSEPFTPEWNYLIKPEISKIYEEYCRTASNHLPATMTNAYGFFHAQGIYEGQRETMGSFADNEQQGISEARQGISDHLKALVEKRVVNLTRSGYIGQQRYGTILWSGDISASWETFGKQIAAGLHFCASGLPYWTVDIGAFFVKNGMQWFWDGQYDDGPKDPAYCELFVRWYQWGAFLPVFRGHGTDFRRELWEFDQPQAPFYDALLAANRLRYELMPYIYSLAGKAWLQDTSIMKPLAFGFPEDRKTWDIMDQYLFGEGMMICPVTTQGYYEATENVQDGARKWRHPGRRVYLPGSSPWHDFWSGKTYPGGSWIEVEVTLDRIPVFVKAGTILPRRKHALSTQEQTDEIQYEVYGGADGVFELYDDAGDGYGYEKGEYTITKLEWSEAEKRLYRNGVEIPAFCPQKV